MNIYKLQLKPNKYGFDPKLMADCIVEIAKFNPSASMENVADGAIAMYGKMFDLATAKGGEVEVPIMQHCHQTKGGAC